MIKTLRITSVIAAVLAVAVFIFPVLFSAQSDQNIRELLNSPDVIEKFNTTDNSLKTTDSQVSPLVQQAQAFALILNPPQPKTLPHSQTGTTNVVREPAGTPQFKVIGTSCYEKNPALSLALIDEPGSGLRWVEQSGTVGHFTIEQIQDGIIIVKSGQETFELVTDKQTIKNPVKDDTPAPAKSSGANSTTTLVITAPQNLTPAGQAQTATPQESIEAQRNAKMEDLLERLQKLTESSATDRIDPGPTEEEKAEMMEHLISTIKSARLSEQEAENITDLGETLESSREEPDLSTPSEEDEDEEEDY